MDCFIGARNSPKETGFRNNILKSYDSNVDLFTYQGDENNLAENHTTFFNGSGNSSSKTMMYQNNLNEQKEQRVENDLCSLSSTMDDNDDNYNYIHNEIDDSDDENFNFRGA